MTIQNFQKVYSVNSTLHAAHLQNTLERAGIPACVIRAQSGSGLDVLVPEEQAEQANLLFHAEPRAGEIFFIPDLETR